MDITPYIRGNKLKIDAEEQSRLNFREEAFRKAQKVALALNEAFPNVEVYLFGSLTTNLFEVDSDIDIAVKGLPEEQYFDAYRMAENITEPIPLDFVQFEFAQNSMKERIMRDGVRL